MVAIASPIIDSSPKLTKLLNQINWFFDHNSFRGTCPNNDIFRTIVPNSDQDDGTFCFDSPPESKGQTTAVLWFKDEGKINFMIRYITPLMQQ